MIHRMTVRHYPTNTGGNVEPDLRPRPPAAPETPAAGDAPDGPNFDGEIDRDLACLRCGYNLRTLRGDARCPECGLGVLATLRRNVTLSETDLRWLDTLKRGVRLVAASMLVWGIALFVLLQAFPNAHEAAPLVTGGPRIWPLAFPEFERQLHFVRAIGGPGCRGAALVRVGHPVRGVAGTGAPGRGAGPDVDAVTALGDGRTVARTLDVVGVGSASGRRVPGSGDL